MANTYPAGPAADLAPGAAKTVTIDGKAVALMNVNGVFYAMDNACAHRGGPLGEGVVDGEAIVCPWHGWQYDVKTGQCLTNPNAKVTCYAVKQEGDHLLVTIE